MSRNYIEIIGLVVFYIVIIFLGALAIEQSGARSLYKKIQYYNLQFGIFEQTAPLTRFDAQWYVSIAAQGYTSTEYNHRFNIAFPPL